MTVRAWMDEGTDLLLNLIGELPFDDPAAGDQPVPRLAGWTRAHLLSHVAFNAEALQRLLRWARTGVETPMYPSPERRDAEIEQGARRPMHEIVDHVRRSATDLADALDELPDDAWDAMVRTAQGRDVPAREVPWMRTREVWVHAVDLDPNGVSFGRFPPDLLDALVTDVIAMFTRRNQLTGLVIEATDTGRRWTVGAAEPSRQSAEDDRRLVRGTAADLAAWLTGRGSSDLVTAENGPPPELPPWL